MKPVILLSDSTGDLGERFVRALISQFPGDSFSLKVYSFIKDEAELDTVFAKISRDQPIIFHTTLVPGLKRRIEDLAATHHCPVYDLTGEAMTFLQRVSGLKSSPTPKTLHELNEAYYRRISSLDFTVSHDDGLSTQTLRDAEIVLLGVSRTSKTPTSIYLAYKGYRVGNIPMVKGLPLPDILSDPSIHLVALTIDAEKLMEIRMRRAREDGAPDSDYTELDSIRKELQWARSVYTRLGCPVVDVTNHAVEETAALVLKALQLR